MVERFHFFGVDESQPSGFQTARVLGPGWGSVQKRSCLTFLGDLFVCQKTLENSGSRR